MVWTEENQYNAMAPQSPDMNIIEYLWDDVFQAVKRRKIPKSLEKLHIAIMDEWQRIPISRIHKFPLDSNTVTRTQIDERTRNKKVLTFTLVRVKGREWLE